MHAHSFFKWRHTNLCTSCTASPTLYFKALWQEGKQPIYIISLAKRELSKQEIKRKWNGKDEEPISCNQSVFFYRRDFHLSKQQDTKRKTPLKYYVLNFWGLTRMIIRIFVLVCHTKQRKCSDCLLTVDLTQYKGNYSVLICSKIS